MISRTKDNELQYCCQLLTSRCDGASLRDGQGWNKFDSQYGRRMAMTPQEKWSSEDKREVYFTLRKYKRQLSEEGVEWESLTEPKRNLKVEKGIDLESLGRF